MKLKSSMADVWSLANGVIAELQHWIETRDKKHIHLKFTPLDQARLTRFRVWEYRYRMSIEEILDLILNPLREQMNLHSRHYGLGVSVRALLGKKAEAILQDHIKRYMGQVETGITWRQREQEKQLLREKQDELDGLSVREATAGRSLLECDSVKEFIRNYELHITVQREELRKASAQRWRRRKNYRGNPFL